MTSVPLLYTILKFENIPAVFKNSVPRVQPKNSGNWAETKVVAQLRLRMRTLGL